MECVQPSVWIHDLEKLTELKESPSNTIHPQEDILLSIHLETSGEHILEKIQGQKEHIRTLESPFYMKRKKKQK